MGMCCLAPFTGISLPHVIALICHLRMRPPKDSPVMHSGNCNKNKTNQMAKPWRRRTNFFPDVHAWLFGTRTLFQDVSGSCKGAHSSPTNAQPHTHTLPIQPPAQLQQCLVIFPQALRCDDDISVLQAWLAVSAWPPQGVASKVVQHILEAVGLATKTIPPRAVRHCISKQLD